MRPAIHNASARQHFGGPSPAAGRGGNRSDRARKSGPSEIETEIAGLLDRSTPELRDARIIEAEHRRWKGLSRILGNFQLRFWSSRPRRSDAAPRGPGGGA